MIKIKDSFLIHNEKEFYRREKINPQKSNDGSVDCRAFCRNLYNGYEPWIVQYIPRNMHTVFALLCFVVVIHWLIFPYPSRLLHWHCGNLTIAPVQAKQPWLIWINTSCEFIMNDCITTTKQSTTKPCAYFLGYTVCHVIIRSGGTSRFASEVGTEWPRFNNIIQGKYFYEQWHLIP